MCYGIYILQNVTQQEEFSVTPGDNGTVQSSSTREIHSTVENNREKARLLMFVKELVMNPIPAAATDEFKNTYPALSRNAYHHRG